MTTFPRFIAGMCLLAILFVGAFAYAFHGEQEQFAKEQQQTSN